MTIRARDTRTLAIDFTAAQDRRTVGIERAVNHANRVESEWSGQAMGHLTIYARQIGRPFLIEEARAFAESHGLPLPPDARAWGAVAQRAARKKHIEKAGFGAAASSNCSPKVLWRAPTTTHH